MPGLARPVSNSGRDPKGRRPIRDLLLRTGGTAATAKEIKVQYFLSHAARSIANQPPAPAIIQTQS